MEIPSSDLSCVLAKKRNVLLPDTFRENIFLPCFVIRRPFYVRIMGPVRLSDKRALQETHHNLKF